MYMSEILKPLNQDVNPYQWC